MSENAPKAPRSRRLRFAPVAVVAGVAATAALALSLNGSLAAFTATITNSTNTAGDGTLVMSESGSTGGTAYTCTSTDGGSVATNSATCATINKYGGVSNLVPGGTSSNTVTITNTGTATASSFTLTPGACTPSGAVTGSATDICTKMTVGLTKTVGGTTTSVIAAGTALSAAATMVYSIGAVAPAGSVSFTFTVTLPAGLTNTYQGLAVSQPLVWQFSAGS